MIDIRRRTTYFFLFVCLGHVLLISAQVQSKSGMPLLESAAVGSFSGVQRLSASIANGLSSLWGRYVALHGVVAENAQLRADIVQLQGQLQEQAALAAQAKALETALHLQSSMAQRTLAARVIGGDPTPGSLTITIDRGTEDGIRQDLGVITTGGVVGRVMGQPLAHTARVQLLTGRAAGAGAMLEQSKSFGTVQGGGNNPPLHMSYVLNSYEVKVGERVLTSGQDGIFPQGFPIGWVEQAERGNTMYKNIAIRPSVNFGHLDVVLVLLDAPPSGGGAQ